NVNQLIQKKDSSHSIIGPDRMHVSKPGYFVMANQFLNSPDIHKKVSNLSIDAEKKKLISQDNCKVENIRATSSSLSFTYLGKSLPFPSPEGINVDSLQAFTDNMNADIIQIKGLKSGAYQLLIDTTIVGLFSNKDFENGINLSKYQKTPQYQQASSILKLFDEYWKTERTLRVMKYVEYSHLASVINKDDMEEVKKVFDSILEKSKTSPNFGFFGNVFKTYLSNKPQEKELVSKLESLHDSIYQINTPVIHDYKIEKVIK
ncbi:MAG: hypothetical protein ABIP35_00835, partial [Ginsengibacter sp.]